MVAVIIACACSVAVVVLFVRSYINSLWHEISEIDRQLHGYEDRSI